MMKIKLYVAHEIFHSNLQYETNNESNDESNNA